MEQLTITIAESSSPSAEPTDNSSVRERLQGNPNYSPITGYIPVELYNKVKARASKEGRGYISNMMASLLTRWLVETEEADAEREAQEKVEAAARRKKELEDAILEHLSEVERLQKELEQ